jgi:HD-GYP domain-containing protein (c-di-GMP phosphodiesterase class II)
MFLSSVQTHAHTIEAKDPYTKGHCNRVEIYSQIIAMELNMTEEERYELQIACLLHDIGKIGVSERILSKPSRLTDEEMDQMKLHPVIGGEIVKDLYGFNIAPIIKHHHERYDGKGYPEGLLGDNIPLGARIIAVADTFDAMTSDRPYRKSLDREIAINELIVFKGKQFDPKMVDAFLNKPEKIEKLHNNLKKMKFNQLTSLISFQDIK